MLENAKDYIIEMFFPSHCVLCDRLGSLLCGNCRDDLFYIKSQSCPVCNRVTEKGKVCPGCRKKLALTGAISSLYFKDEKVKDVLHPYKYEGVFALSGELSNILKRTIEREELSFDVVSYVPTSRKHENKRGYNQAKLIAEELSTVFNKPLFEGLNKKKNVKTQVGLPRKKRIKNIEGAFFIKNGREIDGKKVLLIDDVITTGATLSECAKEFRKVGAREVWAATIAKE